jgi:hypothetical protein
MIDLSMGDYPVALEKVFTYIVKSRLNTYCCRNS